MVLSFEMGGCECHACVAALNSHKETIEQLIHHVHAMKAQVTVLASALVAGKVIPEDQLKAQFAEAEAELLVQLREYEMRLAGMMANKGSA